MHLDLFFDIRKRAGVHRNCDDVSQGCVADGDLCVPLAVFEHGHLAEHILCFWARVVTFVIADAFEC